MLKSNKLKLTKKQSQDGGFLPLLLSALGSLAAPVLRSLFGKWLQAVTGRFAHFPIRPESFRPESFRPRVFSPSFT